MKLVRNFADLFWTFFKIGIVTFGGGIAMLPVIERELVDKRHWTTIDELLDYYSISQSTPGAIAVNVSTFIGYKRYGFWGGITATTGVVTPSVIVITIIALFIGNFSDLVLVQKALTGINVAVAALLTNAVVTFAKKTIKGIFAILLFLGSFTAIFLFKVNTVWIILLSALIGVVVSVCRGEFKHDGSR